METSAEGLAGTAGDEGAAAERAVAVTVEPGTVGVVERVAIAPASLSPSRASDFMQCPLLYRFRVIDRLPEKPSEAATRGTLVHSVLERLFDAPAAERTAPRAKSLIPGQWDRLRESRPEVVELFADDPEGERLSRWLGEAERLVERWFSLEDPTRLEPAEREMFIEAELDSGLKLRGIIDRVDVAPTGDVRIVDYKTGKAPRPEYAEGALFQMKFYALVVWRLKQVVPRRLQLVYLGSGDVVTYDPVIADLERVERKLLALWEAIRLATETGDWRPRPTKLCGWCDHQAVCPEFGGTPPPYPLPVRRADEGGGVTGAVPGEGAVAGAASGDEGGAGSGERAVAGAASGERAEVPGAGSGQGAGAA
ncbi:MULTISPECIES: PD-(D/E)XK nuclease family protein [unclassified Streptomyces]|uniref:RecB family exonuclease n=1 Tax=unclassified Streptomyces TaxID=2593676 RepID=UPI002E2C149E|nr:PD-(D/E)XK nuclease family protein [Streptomyces sp. NBC_00228]